MTVSGFLEQLGLECSPPTAACPIPVPPQASTSDVRYIIVGLHTCGDLGPTMLRVYSQSKQIVGLVSVGCCYMKVTCSPPVPAKGHMTVTCPQQPQDKPEECCMNDIPSRGLSVMPPKLSIASPNLSMQAGLVGYPLSEIVKSLPGHSLSYEAREVACHSIEVYRERLQGTHTL